MGSMPDFSFIHAADLHLDSPLRGLESYPDAPVEQIRGATRRALDNLVELAIEEKVSFILLAGDVYDGPWKDYNTGLFFAQGLGRLARAGIRVFLISGNHDAESVIAKALRPPENVFVFSAKHPETHRIQELDVAVHGQGYPTRDTSADLAALYPLAEPGLFNIGLLHTALTGRPGHESYAPTNLDILKSRGYDYWALGHVHQREVICESPWIIFPGNIQGRHIRESGARGCTLVAVEAGRVVNVESRELDVLRWQECRVDLSGCDRQETFFQKVRQHLEEGKDRSAGRPLAVRLILAGKTSMHDWLHRHAFDWTRDCRVLAAGLGDLWLEKIGLKTLPHREAEAMQEMSLPLTGLIRAVKDLGLAGDLFEQVPELAELMAKLPFELTAAEEPFDLCRSEELFQLQEDVRELLLARLLRQGRER
jgi:DNA repair protein SbcD/Mre11